MISSSREASVDASMDPFEFVDGGRTFVCSMGVLGSRGTEEWWWFQLASEKRGQRYAPFRASADDTQASVRARILAYHDNLLAQQAMPATRSAWGGRPRVNPLPASVSGVEAPTA
jgi:hypothetical protein